MPDTTAARPLPAFVLLANPKGRRQDLILARKAIREAGYPRPIDHGSAWPWSRSRRAAG